MRRIYWLAALLAAGCSSRPDLSVERTAILAADSAWLAAAQSRNAEAAIAFWTPDARVIAPGQPAYVGQDAIHKMVTGGFATPGFSISWKTTDVVVAPSGDFAYSFATNAVTVPGAKGGLDTLRGQAVVVWKKSEGRWRAAVDTWTPQAP